MTGRIRAQTQELNCLCSNCLLIVRPWSVHLTMLCLSFRFFKMWIKTAAIYKAAVSMNISTNISASTSGWHIVKAMYYLMLHCWLLSLPSQGHAHMRHSVGCEYVLNDYKRQHKKKMLQLRREDGARLCKSEELTLKTLCLRSISFHVDEDLDILFHVNSKNQ